MSTSDMLTMLRRSPEQKDKIERLSLHMFLTERMLQRINEEKLLEGLGNLEQDIACGVDQYGKDVKTNNLHDRLARFFSEAQSGLAHESRLRLLMLYFACIANISEVVRRRLTEAAQLEAEDQAVLLNMMRTRLMEVPDSQRHKMKSGYDHRVTKQQAARFKKNAEVAKFEASRFEPRIKVLLEQLAEKKLAQEDFPKLGGMLDDSGHGPRSAGSANGAKPLLASTQAPNLWSFEDSLVQDTNSTDDAQEEVSQRIVVFVLGGITYSELRAASEVALSLPRGVEVLIGGTSLLTPNRLMNALRPYTGSGKNDGLGETVQDPLDLT